MNDFASAVLVGAVHRALRNDGIAIDASPLRDALVPLSDKRRLLAAVADAYGLLPLLRVGLVLPTMPADPAISALAAARDPADLFLRWSRLERFTHSRHRVVVREVGAHHLVAEHVGLPHQRPAPCEDALIVGVLAALLERIGARGLSVRIGAHDSFGSGRWTLPAPEEPASLWTFSWDAIDILGPGGSAKCESGADAITSARRLLSADLGCRWTLTMLAQALKTSSRSLQRSLAADGGFGGLFAAARSDAAANMLIEATLPLSIVGFACGYADQSHFTREFKRRTAFTPAAYRAAFAKFQDVR